MDTTGQTVPSAAASGSPAFDEILAAYQAPLLRYVTRLLNNSDYAQDVVQETFVKLINIWSDRSRPGANLRPWLYRVAHNLAVDHVRRESRLHRLHEKEAEERRAGVDCLDEKAKREDRVQAALDNLRHLSPEERQIVLLRLQEGLSYREISRITGRTEGNIGCILHHAVRKVAERLKKSGLAGRGGAS